MTTSWLAFTRLAAATVTTLAVMATPSSSHEAQSSDQIRLAQAIVPQAEMSRAQELLAKGPTESSGISAVNVLNQLPLDGEFTSSDGLIMRVREIVIDPGGIVAVHQHHKRPGIAYVMTGEMTEHRSTDPLPHKKTAGDVSMEKSGVIHWWENTGSVPSRAIVVDIIPAN